MIKTIGIIGYGQFGVFLDSLIKKYFPEIKIKISSRSHKNDNEKFFDLDEVLKSDLIFLTVPIKNIAEVVENIQEKISQNSILIDVATVKEYPEVEIKKYPHLKYICSHPMFGPFSYEKIGQKLDGLRLVLTSHNLNRVEHETLKNILVKKLKLDLVEMTAQEHDKLLAETLFLTHFISQTVVKAGYKRTDIDTVSFGFLMSAVESVKNDFELFKDVYKYNKYCHGIVENFEESIGEVKKELLK